MNNREINYLCDDNKWISIDQHGNPTKNGLYEIMSSFDGLMLNHAYWYGNKWLKFDRLTDNNDAASYICIHPDKSERDDIALDKETLFTEIRHKPRWYRHLTLPADVNKDFLAQLYCDTAEQFDDE